MDEPLYMYDGIAMYRQHPIDEWVTEQMKIMETENISRLEAWEKMVRRMRKKEHQKRLETMYQHTFAEQLGLKVDPVEEFANYYADSHDRKIRNEERVAHRKDDTLQNMCEEKEEEEQLYTSIEYRFKQWKKSPAFTEWLIKENGERFEEYRETANSKSPPFEELDEEKVTRDMVPAAHYFDTEVPEVEPFTIEDVQDFPLDTVRRFLEEFPKYQRFFDNNVLYEDPFLHMMLKTSDPLMATTYQKRMEDLEHKAEIHGKALEEELRPLQEYLLTREGERERVRQNLTLEDHMKIRNEKMERATSLSEQGYGMSPFDYMLQPEEFQAILEQMEKFRVKAEPEPEQQEKVQE